MSCSWYDRATSVIREIDKTIPPGATLKQRRSLIRAAYPFGPRKYFPYKAWCKAQAEYLRRFESSIDMVAEKRLSPLERLMKGAPA